MQDEFHVRLQGSPAATTYYTDDLADALGTGKLMAQQRSRRKPALLSHAEAAVIRSNARLHGAALATAVDKVMEFQKRSDKVASELGLPSAQPDYEAMACRETTHAVFEVRTGKRILSTDKGQVICHIEYVGLCGQLTAQQALPIITQMVQERYETRNVQFRFWCYGQCSTGGSPTYLMKCNGAVEVRQ